MHSDSLGAAAGFAPERSSLTGGVPSVSNAGVVGGVIHLAAVLRVAHVRLRRAMEHAVQRPAPRAGTARPPGAPHDEGASAPSVRTGRAPASASAHDLGSNN